ncbi:hypothetical protein ASE77_18710 [Sphingomonas sp. Leaf226]|nr:hypothetical protein ASE77_18710 [Sphingomonas sp. Leaf226]
MINTFVMKRSATGGVLAGMMSLVKILYPTTVREEAAYSDFPEFFGCQGIYRAGKSVIGRERRRWLAASSFPLFFVSIVISDEIIVSPFHFLVGGIVVEAGQS